MIISGPWQGAEGWGFTSEVLFEVSIDYQSTSLWSKRSEYAPLSEAGCRRMADDLPTVGHGSAELLSTLSIQPVIKRSDTGWMVDVPSHELRRMAQQHFNTILAV